MFFLPLIRNHYILTNLSPDVPALAGTASALKN